MSPPSGRVPWPLFCLLLTCVQPPSSLDESERGGAWVQLGGLSLSADVAFERLLNPGVSYSPNAVLLSLGAGWRFPVQLGF